MKKYSFKWGKTIKNDWYFLKYCRELVTKNTMFSVVYVLLYMFLYINISFIGILPEIRGPCVKTYEPQHIRPRLRRNASYKNRGLAAIRPRIRATPVPRSHGNRMPSNVNVMNSRFRSLTCSFCCINFFRLTHTILKTWWGVTGLKEKNKSLFPSSVTSYKFSGSPRQVLIKQLSAWIPFNLYGIHAFSTIVKKQYRQIWIVSKACHCDVVTIGRSRDNKLYETTNKKK